MRLPGGRDRSAERAITGHPMSDVDEPRQRGEAAKLHSGLVTEGRWKYSERFNNAISAIKDGILAKAAEVDRLQDEIAHIRCENEQLKGMLDSLLQLIESDRKDELDGSRHDRETRLNALVE